MYFLVYIRKWILEKWRLNVPSFSNTRVFVVVNGFGDVWPHQIVHVCLGLFQWEGTNRVVSLRKRWHKCLFTSCKIKILSLDWLLMVFIAFRNELEFNMEYMSQRKRSHSRVTFRLNSSPPRAAYMRRWTGLALVPAMACPVPSHYLNQCWLIVNWIREDFSAILIEISTFSFEKMCLKMSSAKWRPFCSVGNKLM